MKDCSIRKVINKRNVSDRRMPHAGDEAEAFIKPADGDADGPLSSSTAFRLASEPSMSFEAPQADSYGALEGVIDVRETAKLSFHFSVLWVHVRQQAYRKPITKLRGSLRYVREWLHYRFLLMLIQGQLPLKCLLGVYHSCEYNYIVIYKQ